MLSPVECHTVLQKNCFKITEEKLSVDIKANGHTSDPYQTMKLILLDPVVHLLNTAKESINSW